MLFDLSGVTALSIVIVVIAAAASLTALASIAVSLTRHHRVRLARHQSIPAYYRRLTLAH
ncbi:hypothetical protein [Nocardioides flavescens]|uniref:Uncharacterized protein n=1 Tax=Nocardioides flavescens TaxID=2691959 RepID=A0A6L7ERQ5_9ACTN|nr:hypothetical protein [Nocardioides flavescens]MXG88258.1 hypothetical protein [Nocardioides flavescens]